MLELLLALFVGAETASGHPAVVSKPVAVESAKPWATEPTHKPANHRPTMFPPEHAEGVPLEYQRIIMRAMLQHPTLSEPEDIARQIQAESNYRADAVSPAGAKGPCQFLDATAAELGVTDPYDPEQCVPAMVEYVGWCQRGWTPPAFGGRDNDDIKELGSGCYNFGRGAMFGNQRKHGWTTACEALPHLPAETRNYIGKVHHPDCGA